MATPVGPIEVTPKARATLAARRQKAQQERYGNHNPRVTHQNIPGRTRKEKRQWLKDRQREGLEARRKATK